MATQSTWGLISRVSSRTYRSFTTIVTNMEQIGDSRSFQKQATIKVVQNKLNKTVQKRYVKNVGLGIKTPKDARSMSYVDKKCPFTGNVAIRGRLLSGVVTKLKMQRSCTVRRDYLHYIKKYQRFEKRHKMVSAHVSRCWRDIAVGDLVTIGECRPLSKTINFNVVKINKVRKMLFKTTPEYVLKFS